MYDPTIGRWISEDPLGFKAGDANLSRYVANRPTKASDPSGLDWDWQGNTSQDFIRARPAPPFPSPGSALPPAVSARPGGNSTFRGFCNMVWLLTPSDRPTMLGAHPLRPAPRQVPPGALFDAQGAGIQGTGVQGGTVQFCPSPLNPGPNGAISFAGTSGCGPSIGLIITSPSGTAIFHFGATNGNVAATIGQYTWPSGSHAVICGGNNTTESNTTMENVIASLSANGITLDGIMDTTNCYIGSDGNWYTNP